MKLTSEMRKGDAILKLSDGEFSSGQDRRSPCWLTGLLESSLFKNLSFQTEAETDREAAVGAGLGQQETESLHRRCSVYFIHILYMN